MDKNNILQVEPFDSSVIKLVQITDSHLEHTVGGTLLGMNTDQSLRDVIDLVSVERPQLDVLLATGDISNCGSVESYKRFFNYTSSLATHSVWLPGNHDLNDGMAVAVGDGEQLSKTINIGNWKILMLDSSVDGKVGGYLSAAELQFLDDSLANSGDCYVLVCLHHPPQKTGSKWSESQIVSNHQKFFQIMDQYEHVQAVIWGHIHQEVDRNRHNVRLMASPSTCVQFLPNSADFMLDRLSPGYRWLELLPDGVVRSGVSRVKDFVFDIAIDFDGDNYY